VFVIEGGNVPFRLFPLPEGWRVGPAARSWATMASERRPDILLGITGTFVVRWSVANLTISLEGVQLAPANVVRNRVDQCQFDLRALMLTTVALVADIAESRGPPSGGHGGMGNKY